MQQNLHESDPQNNKNLHEFATCQNNPSNIRKSKYNKKFRHQSPFLRIVMGDKFLAGAVSG